MGDNAGIKPNDRLVHYLFSYIKLQIKGLNEEVQVVVLGKIVSGYGEMLVPFALTFSTFSDCRDYPMKIFWIGFLFFSMRLKKTFRLFEGNFQDEQNNFPFEFVLNFHIFLKSDFFWIWKIFLLLFLPKNHKRLSCFSWVENQNVFEKLGSFWQQTPNNIKKASFLRQ